MRMGPVVIRSLLLAFSIDPRQIDRRRRPDPGGFRERRQKLFVALAAVSPDVLRKAAFASSVVASTPIVLPLTKPAPGLS